MINFEEGLEVETRTASGEKVDEWLLIVHTPIANLKCFLLGTVRGVASAKLQQYVDEFVYRDNRRF